VAGAKKETAEEELRREIEVEVVDAHPKRRGCQLGAYRRSNIDWGAYWVERRQRMWHHPKERRRLMYGRQRTFWSEKTVLA
jgi:hypothetical protein